MIADWDQGESRNVNKLKATFLERFRQSKEWSTLSEKIDTIDLLNENDRPVQVIKDKMDVFVRRSKVATSASSSPTTTTTSSKQSSNATVKKQSKAISSDQQNLSPQALLIAQQLQTQASECFNKKKYNVAAQLFTQLLELGVDRAGCLSNLGTIYSICGVHNKCAECLQEVVDMKKYDYQTFARLGDAYFELKEYKKALENFSFANQVFEKFAQSSDVDQKTKLAVTDEHHRLKIKLGKAAYFMGQKDAGFAVIASVLKENEQNHDGLIEYGYIMMDSKDEYEEALTVLLRCLVKEQSNKRVKKLITDLIRHPKAGVKMLLEQLLAAENDSATKSAEGVAPALAWIAMVVKEHSAVDESIEIYKKALEFKPSSASFILNLVHTMELQIKYQEAIVETKKFLTNNPDLRVGNYMTAKQFLTFMNQITDVNSTRDFRYGEHAIEYSKNWSLQWVSEKGSKLVPRGETAEEWPTKKSIEKFSAEELDLLALFFTVLKILFVSGAISALPPIFSQLEPTRVDNKLHETTIRNEQAYFACTSQVMVYLANQLPIAHGDSRPLYVCGESHCLSPAWQVINFDGEHRTLTPVLVTGLKCWHMRDESDFYPKANFEYAIKTIPDNEQVVFMFGEIDCREGIFLAVEKCRYKDLEDGIEVAIDIYLNKLLQIQKDRGFDIYIHPVLPVLDPTRDTVKIFNAIMTRKLTELNSKVSDPKKQLKWLSFFDHLLTADRTKLRKEYELDGTHIHPSYVHLVEQALNKHCRV